LGEIFANLFRNLLHKSHRINLTYSEIFANCENFKFLEIFDRVRFLLILTKKKWVRFLR
jgi:hypothetical protein